MASDLEDLIFLLPLGIAQACAAMAYIEDRLGEPGAEFEAPASQGQRPVYLPRKQTWKPRRVRAGTLGRLLQRARRLSARSFRRTPGASRPLGYSRPAPIRATQGGYRA